jgi:type I restriction enzyme R subunit
MSDANPSRQSLVEKLEALVAQYNAGAIDAEKFFEALNAFVCELDKEEQRAAREGLTDEELAIFDLLTTPEPKLTKAEEQQVKAVARQLLERLHNLVDAVSRLLG